MFKLGAFLNVNYLDLQFDCFIARLQFKLYLNLKEKKRQSALWRNIFDSKYHYRNNYCL